MLYYSGGEKDIVARLALHYIPTNSILHRWDSRCKLLGLIIITTTLINSKTPLLILNSILLLSIFFLARLPLVKILKDLTSFMILIFLIFIFQILFSPGQRIGWLPISKEGLLAGVFTAWRLFILIGFAIIFTSITRPKELRDAIIWFLKPFPFLPERRIGLMISLSMRFFSRILDRAEEVRLANKARFGELSKNPFKKLKSLALPILRQSILDVEEVTFSLASRGYNEDHPVEIQKLNLIHFLPIFILVSLIIILY